MDKSLVNRLEKLEQRTAEHSDASLLSTKELMKIISDDLGYEPTIEEVIQLALEDMDADEVPKE
jgi:hypothetical protein